MPKKFRLGRHYKNGERKKRAAKQALLSAATVTPSELVISIPLNIYYETPVYSQDALKMRLQTMNGIPNGNTDCLIMCILMEVWMCAHQVSVYTVYMCTLCYRVESN